MTASFVDAGPAVRGSIPCARFSTPSHIWLFSRFLKAKSRIENRHATFACNPLQALLQQTTGKLADAHLIEVALSISTHQRSRVRVHLESML